MLHTSSTPAPSKRSLHLLLLALLATGLPPATAQAESLRGSRKSMDRQVQAARQHDFTYLRNPAHVRHFVRKGWLVRVPGNADYQLSGVAFPYARPEIRLFVERLGGQYRAACGEPLVVTSLTRPKTHQPRNASPRSIHPTGMGLDLRRSRKRACRRWLENTLLYLEARDVLEVTYEHRPPHYHLAVFPSQYRAYVRSLRSPQRIHRVNPGESLWKIARKYETTVHALKRANGLRSSRIFPGQKLKISS